TISRELHTISRELHTISRELHTISRDLHKVSSRSRPEFRLDPIRPGIPAVFGDPDPVRLCSGKLAGTGFFSKLLLFSSIVPDFRLYPNPAPMRSREADHVTLTT
ncbi:MAG: hypothetical protein GY820_12450, partial [Gammaproteobacteria bacterium]|nr:hypothetical protein [Gammaproteobacteria bacterium]